MRNAVFHEPTIERMKHVFSEIQRIYETQIPQEQNDNAIAEPGIIQRILGRFTGRY